MEINFKCELFENLSVQQLRFIYQLRAEVFVVEQNCAYCDVDETDELAYHLFALENQKVMAYARLIPAGITYTTCSIGRVVIHPSWRKQKLGQALMHTAIKKCIDLFNTDSITISAQLYLQRFYENLGFNPVGDVYLEDNIPHLKMIYDKKSSF